MDELKRKYVLTHEHYTSVNQKKLLLVIKALLDFEIPDESLASIETLYFGGENEIYRYLLLDWDGEDSLFNIRSVGGFEQLVNLKSFSTTDNNVMIYQKMIDAGITVSLDI